MRRAKDRLITAALAAGLILALGTTASARAADDGSQVPTPSPSALPSTAAPVGGVQGAPTSAPPTASPTTPSPTTATPTTTTAPTASPTTAAPPMAGAGDQSPMGRLADELIAPLLVRVRLAVGLIITAGPDSSTSASAATLPPGGGASTSTRDWRPKAPIQVPKAASVPAPETPRAKLTKEQIIWAAYVSAATAKAKGCHLPVMLLAAIGEVESSTLRGRSLDAAHDAVPPVFGPALSGGAYSAMRDTDGGRLDGDPVWDRAVGPMQFIPATWQIWGADGNGDGVADPQNIEDAALAAARYLCAGGRDLSRPADLRAAVFSYNHSARYVATVLGLVEAVTSGVDAGP